MSKFFDDTMQGLLEAAALKKGNKTSKQDWIKLGYSNEETEELSRLEEINANNIGHIKKIDDVSEELITLMKQFDNPTNKIIDKLNQL